METIYKGRVKWFATDRQPVGFIRAKHQGTFFEVFVHYSKIMADNQPTKYRSLAKGDWVEFLIGPGYLGVGTQALKVRKLDAGFLQRQGSPGNTEQRGQVA
jgi:cold shock CspA family protein